MTDNAVSRAMRTIEGCVDAQQLRQIAENARRKGQMDVCRAAELRLYEILPSKRSGTFEHDVWRSIYALEGTLSAERDKTTRLSRTRQKIARVGELETVRDLVLAVKPSEGFFMLVERNMADFTFERVALRHSERFETEVLEAAVGRLHSVGVHADRP